MAHRSIGQERLGFADSARAPSSLNEFSELIDWSAIGALLRSIHASAKEEAPWPPLSMFKALLLSVIAIP